MVVYCLLLSPFLLPWPRHSGAYPGHQKGDGPEIARHRPAALGSSLAPEAGSRNHGGLPRDFLPPGSGPLYVPYRPCSRQFGCPIPLTFGAGLTS